jgi:hypothetical protein
MDQNIVGVPPVQMTKPCQTAAQRQPGPRPPPPSHHGIWNEAPSSAVDLRHLFHDVVELPLPAGFTDLLARLDAQ